MDQEISKIIDDPSNSITGVSEIEGSRKIMIAKLSGNVTGRSLRDKAKSGASAIKELCSPLFPRDRGTIHDALEKECIMTTLEDESVAIVFSGVVFFG